MTTDPRPALVEAIAFAAFCCTFHPDDIDNGTADKMWATEEWPDDMRRARRSAELMLQAIRDHGMVVVSSEHLARLSLRAGHAAARAEVERRGCTLDPRIAAARREGRDGGPCADREPD